jgi:hypothetical protein
MIFMASSRKIEIRSHAWGSQGINFVEEHARFVNTKTFGSLDGLRAIAILAVLWHHRQ